MDDLPIFWSFRRCPYAMRARLAIRSSRVQVKLREILLRDKPAAFLTTSPKGTVPVLSSNADVIDESRDVMIWALGQNDPEGWLDMPSEGFALIDTCDGPFKSALDQTKYSVRHPDVPEAQARATAMVFLRQLNDQLSTSQYLTAGMPKISDMAIFPFVRQFANTDRAWFDAQGLSKLTAWLDEFLGSEDFAAIMTKYIPWQPGQNDVLFP